MSSASAVVVATPIGAPDSAVAGASTAQSPDAPERTRLELEKLELEVAVLRRKWWQSPTLASAIGVGLVTLGVSWYAGVFDLMRKQIELETNRSKFEKERALVELANVRTERDQIRADIQKQAAIRDEIKIESQKLTEKKDAASVALAQTQGELATARLAVGGAQAARDRAIAGERAAIERTKKTEAVLRDLARPSLLVVRNHLMVESNYGFEFRNLGPGPAVLKRNRYFIDGTPMPEGATLRNVADALGINATFMRWYEYDPGERLPKGAEMKYFWVREEEFSPSNAAKFMIATERLAIAVCSCSIDGTCGWATYGQVTGDPGVCQ